MKTIISIGAIVAFIFTATITTANNLAENLGLNDKQITIEELMDK